MKILVVEDELKTGDYLKQGLVEAGFIVDLVRDGVDGFHQGTSEEYDLAILDVMLPGMDGWRLLQELRKAGKEMPVLFLTARDQVEDRVKGLELGADDYLVKPFAFSELLARVRTLLRRGSRSKEPDILKVANLELDLMRRKVSRSGKRIDLTAKEFALLELLMRRQGEVLPRSLIASQIWDMNFDSDTNVIEVAVRSIGVILMPMGCISMTVVGMIIHGVPSCENVLRSNTGCKRQLQVNFFLRPKRAFLSGYVYVRHGRTDALMDIKVKAGRASFRRLYGSSAHAANKTG